MRFAASGLTCGGCVSTVKGALDAVPGVTSATVTLTGAAVAGSASAEACVAAAAGVGKTLAPITRRVYSVEGMTCGGCVGGVKEAIQGVRGVESVEVELEGRAVVVGSYAAGVEEAVGGVGKKAVLVEGESEVVA